MRVVGVILARYDSSRLPGKPLLDLCGHPMLWWVYHQASKVKEIDYLLVATDDDRILDMCRSNSMNCMMTSPSHDTPTSRLHEVSSRVQGDMFVFLGVDEPLIEPEAISAVINASYTDDFYATNAMTTIQKMPEVVDFTNIKIVTNTDGYCLYTSRSPLPYPKGGLDFEYKKFVGIGAFSKEALQFYADTPRSRLERIEECDLLRFIDKGKPVRMVDVCCRNLSVDTPKDFEFVKNILQKKIEQGEIDVK